MKICCWNIRRASGQSEATWDYLAEINPDIALLQEVTSIHPKFKRRYKSLWLPARNKDGGDQKFGTAVLLRGDVLAPIKLSTKWAWANELMNRFAGNLVGLQVDCGPNKKLNVMSIYAPAWPIPNEEWEGEDVSNVQSEYSPGQVWLSDLLLAALRNEDLMGQDWVLGGDLNSSITFDHLWGNEPRGNLAYLEEMEALGLLELLRHHQGELTPTFRNPRGGKIIHQIDHLFASPSLQAQLTSCDVGDKEKVFAEESLSDHLPIIAEFE